MGTENKFKNEIIYYNGREIAAIYLETQTFRYN